MSDTPKTDILEFNYATSGGGWGKPFDLAREFERENSRLREAGKALRDALAFECHKIGDVPREIDEWDALVPASPNVQAQR